MMNNKYDALVYDLRLYADCKPIENSSFSLAMRKAADAIESLCAELEKLKKREKDVWIKCSERMPDTVKVWGCVKIHENGYTFYQEEVVVYEKDGEFVDLFKYPVPVVAWQPLPEPYKESEEDTE